MDLKKIKIAIGYYPIAMVWCILAVGNDVAQQKKSWQSWHLHSRGNTSLWGMLCLWSTATTARHARCYVMMENNLKPDGNIKCNKFCYIYACDANSKI